MPGTPQSKELRRRRAELQAAVGKKVLELREAAPAEGGRLTQQDLANRVQDLIEDDGGSLTHQKVISKIESGRHTLTLEVIDLLARALYVDPIFLLESAFHFAPRDAEEIARRRVSQFQARIDAALDMVSRQVEANAESALGRRAALALAQLAIHSPDDLPGAVGMLEGLLIHRGLESAQANAVAGLDAAGHSVLKAQSPDELAEMLDQMTSDELRSMLAGFFFQIGATLKFADRLQVARGKNP